MKMKMMKMMKMKPLVTPPVENGEELFENMD